MTGVVLVAAALGRGADSSLSFVTAGVQGGGGDEDRGGGCGFGDARRAAPPHPHSPAPLAARAASSAPASQRDAHTSPRPPFPPNSRR